MKRGGSVAGSQNWDHPAEDHSGGAFWLELELEPERRLSYIKDAVQAEKGEENHCNFFIPLLSSVIAVPHMIGIQTEVSSQNLEALEMQPLRICRRAGNGFESQPARGWHGCEVKPISY